MKIIIKNQMDISKAQQLNFWLKLPLVRRVEIDLNNLSAEESQKAEKKIKYLFNDCGCFYGEVIMFSFLILKTTPLVVEYMFEYQIRN